MTDWVLRAERAYVVAATGAPAAATGAASPEDQRRAVAAAGAIASRFLAVGTPRSFGIIADDLADGELALAAHRTWFQPRDVRCAGGCAAALAAAVGGRAVSIDEALACDITNVYAPIAIGPAQLRRGTHANLAAQVTLAPELVADVTREAGLPALAAGLVDGRQLDELTVFWIDGAPIALAAAPG